MFKRILVLAAGVLLFIAAFIIFFDVSHKEMEDHFKAERVKFGVEGVVLTSSAPPASPTTTRSPINADGNTLIGPVPPSTPTAPAPATDATPAPPTPDSNAAPAPTQATPSSSMNYPRDNRSPFFQLASYHADADATGELAQALPGATVQTVTQPAANSTSAPTPAATAPQAATRSEEAGEGSVIVLLYHQFKPAGVAIPAKFQWTMNVDVLAYEMKYIHDNGYNVISMDQLIKFIKHEGTVPPRAVVITIDDGYKSAVVYAAPILKQYNYPWTFFIYPDFVTVAEGSGAVSWNDLIELQKDGVDIESHSMTHPNLKLHHQKVKGVWHDFTADEYAAWLNNETAGSKAELEQHLGKPVTRFAYPYGEYNKQVEAAAIAAGYEAIFTVADNPVHTTTNLHSIGRYTITQAVEKNFAAYLRQGALGLSSVDPAPGATTTNPRPVITAVLGYSGTLDPKAIETSVRDYGDVKHDFDPATNTIRLYLPRDLIAPVVLVNIRVQDATTKQVMVANWHFNYEPASGAAAPTAHAPIATPAPAPQAIPPVPSSAPPPVVAPSATNAPAISLPEPLEKASGTPIDARPAPVTIQAPAPATQKQPD